MTRIRFYTDVDDTPALIRQLVVAALARQRQVTIYLRDRQHALAVSAFLWAQPAASFLPNVLADTSEAAHTPIHLAWLPEHIQQDDLLFNCQPVQPLFFGRFQHLFEIISGEEADKAAGRQRWAFYRDRGYAVEHIKPAERIKPA